jgi:tellurite resistance protein
MKLDTPARACAAMAVLIAGADEVGTMEESRFLFETVAAQPVFVDLDRAGFKKLMEETTEWIWSSFPTEGGHVAEEGVTQIVGLISRALPVEHREDALKAAVGLARADGITSEEESLLARLCIGLEVDPAVVQGTGP